MVRHACNPSYSGDRGQEDREFKASPGKVSKTLCQKENMGGNKYMAQVVEHLPSMPNALAEFNSQYLKKINFL
jgi:hypothetical protein